MKSPFRFGNPLPARRMWKLNDRVRLGEEQAPPGLFKKHQGRVATVVGFEEDFAIRILWDGSKKPEGWHKNYFVKVPR